jgi:predicted ATP-dependent serine protease
MLCRAVKGWEARDVAGVGSKNFYAGMAGNGKSSLLMRLLKCVAEQRYIYMSLTVQCWQSMSSCAQLPITMLLTTLVG